MDLTCSDLMDYVLL